MLEIVQKINGYLSDYILVVLLIAVGLDLLRSPHLLLLKTPVVRFGKQLSIPSPPVLFPKKTLQEATFPTLGSE